MTNVCTKSESSMSENEALQASIDTGREMKKTKITMECTLAMYMYAISWFSSVIKGMLLP